MSRRASLDDLPPPDPMSPRQWATYVQYLAVWEAAARLPDPIAWRLPDVVGDAWHRLSPSRQRAQVRANQARIVRHLDEPEPVLEQRVPAAYRSYARYWLDAFRAHTFDADEVLERTVLEGDEHLDAVRADGGGAIIATGHLGSWDVGAFYSTRRGWELTVVAEVLEPRPLFERFVRLRRDLGLGVIPLVRGGDVIGRLEEAVREGRTATLLADRDLTKEGPVVEFFGEPCRLPPGPAALARRTGRPVCVGAFFETPRGWRVRVYEPMEIAHLDVVEGTQRVAHGLERLISEAPEQWHVFVPNWLADREPDHPAVTEVEEDP